MPPIPATPGRGDALAALALLEDLLEKFPFADEASRSVALSALITPVVRAAYPVAPMHVISAPAAGSGKSYILDVIAAILMGQPCPVLSHRRPDEPEPLPGPRRDPPGPLHLRRERALLTHEPAQAPLSLNG